MRVPAVMACALVGMSGQSSLPAGESLAAVLPAPPTLPSRRPDADTEGLSYSPIFTKSTSIRDMHRNRLHIPLRRL